MNKPNTQTGTETKNEKGYVRNYTEITSFAVSQVKMWDGGNVSFTLELNGITIYGCRIVEMEHGDFVGFPSKKGKDDKWYRIAYAELSRETQEAIIKAVEQQLGENYGGQ